MKLNILCKYYHSHDKTSSFEKILKLALIEPEKQFITRLFLVCIYHIYCTYSKT